MKVKRVKRLPNMNIIFLNVATMHGQILEILHFCTEYTEYSFTQCVVEYVKSIVLRCLRHS
jgi:hypothetical protein